MCERKISIDEMQCNWMQNTCFHFQGLLQSNLDITHYMSLGPPFRKWNSQFHSKQESHRMKHNFLVCSLFVFYRQGDCTRWL